MEHGMVCTMGYKTPFIFCWCYRDRIGMGLLKVPVLVDNGADSSGIGASTITGFTASGACSLKSASKSTQRGRSMPWNAVALIF